MEEEEEEAKEVLQISILRPEKQVPFIQNVLYMNLTLNLISGGKGRCCRKEGGGETSTCWGEEGRRCGRLV